MYNGIEKIKEIIDFIEDNIINEINCAVLSQKMNLSVYEFRRIFSFIIGCPLSEYIRKRRLSLAGCEILTSERIDLSKISEKYQYGSQSAFTKAFKEFHGFSPSEIKKSKNTINLFPVPKLEFSVSETDALAFKIIDERDFSVTGYSGISEITDTCCCESIWNKFYENETDKKISSDKIYAVYENFENNVRCTIGSKNATYVEDLTTVSIEKSKWACFFLDTVDDNEVNNFYSKITYEYLPSAGLMKNTKLPTVEIYPANMDNEGFEWEIRVAVSPAKTA